MCNNCKPFNMCLGESYCVKCRKKEYYNSSDPLTQPSKCKHCGGRMTTYQTEKLLKSFEKDIECIVDNIEKNKRKMKEERKNKRTKEDQFILNLLESLKNEFDGGEMYYGFYIKQVINKMIKRME